MKYANEKHDPDGGVIKLWGKQHSIHDRKQMKKPNQTSSHKYVLEELYIDCISKQKTANVPPVYVGEPTIIYLHLSKACDCFKLRAFTCLTSKQIDHTRTSMAHVDYVTQTRKYRILSQQLQKVNRNWYTQFTNIYKLSEEDTNGMICIVESFQTQVEKNVKCSTALSGTT